MVVLPPSCVEVRTNVRGDPESVQLKCHTSDQRDGSAMDGSVAEPVPALDRYGTPAGLARAGRRAVGCYTEN